MNDMVKFPPNYSSHIRGLTNLCMSVIYQVLRIQILMA